MHNIFLLKIFSKNFDWSLFFFYAFVHKNMKLHSTLQFDPDEETIISNAYNLIVR